MSFATSDKLVNPIQMFHDWEGKDSNGFFSNWNKETKKKDKSNFSKFAIIDIWYSIKWYDQAKELGIYSNEVKHLGSKMRAMYSGSNAPIVEGKYSDIKDTINAKGGSLNLCVSMINVDTGTLEHFTLKGQAYFDFSQMLKKVQGVQDVKAQKYPILEFTGAELIEWKAFNYNLPKFELTSEFISADLVRMLAMYSTKIDQYYEQMKEKYGKDGDESEAPAEDGGQGYYQPEESKIETDEEFAARIKAEKAWTPESSVKDTVNKDSNGEEISIEKIPF